VILVHLWSLECVCVCPSWVSWRPPKTKWNEPRWWLQPFFPRHIDFAENEGLPPIASECEFGLIGVCPWNQREKRTLFGAMTRTYTHYFFPMAPVSRWRDWKCHPCTELRTPRGRALASFVVCLVTRPNNLTRSPHPSNWRKIKNCVVFSLQVAQVARERRIQYLWARDWSIFFDNSSPRFHMGHLQAFFWNSTLEILLPSTTQQPFRPRSPLYQIRFLIINNSVFKGQAQVQDTALRMPSKWRICKEGKAGNKTRQLLVFSELPSLSSAGSRPGCFHIPWVVSPGRSYGFLWAVRLIKKMWGRTIQLRLIRQ
jgi:hypothetical protein